MSGERLIGTFIGPVHFEDTSLKVGTHSHPIEKSEELIRPSGDYRGYVIQEFRFLDENAKMCSGAEFRIQPYGSTSVVEIFQGSNTAEMLIEGNGSLLMASPDGKVSVYHLKETCGSVEFCITSEDGASCWVAGERGARVLDITSPPYDPNTTERTIPLDSKELPDLFWASYRILATKSELLPEGVIFIDVSKELKE